MDDTKLCPCCNQVKPVDDFNFKKKSEGKRQVYCRECARAYIRDHYARNQGYYVEKALKRNKMVTAQHRELIAAYLSAHPCVDCGEGRIVCLEFDHVRENKFKPISEMVGNHAWKKIEEEIAKCDVRCANCHYRKTAQERGWRKLILDKFEDTKDNRSLVIEYLLSHPCVDCGETDIVCLTFDHVRGLKFKNLSEMVSQYDWDTIRYEMKKCEVRCANCHRIKTAKQFDYWSTEHI